MAEILNKDEAEAPAKAKSNYQAIFNKSQLDKIIKDIKAKKQFAFDTETTSLDAM